MKDIRVKFKHYDLSVQNECEIKRHVFEDESVLYLSYNERHSSIEGHYRYVELIYAVPNRRDKDQFDNYLVMNEETFLLRDTEKALSAFSDRVMSQNPLITRNNIIYAGSAMLDFQYHKRNDSAIKVEEIVPLYENCNPQNHNNKNSVDIGNGDWCLMWSSEDYEGSSQFCTAYQKEIFHMVNKKTGRYFLVDMTRANRPLPNPARDVPIVKHSAVKLTEAVKELVKTYYNLSKQMQVSFVCHTGRLTVSKENNAPEALLRHYNHVLHYGRKLVSADSYSLFKCYYENNLSVEDVEFNFYRDSPNEFCSLSIKTKDFLIDLKSQHEIPALLS